MPISSTPLPMIEILESRIAPAGVFYYTDGDGNKVKVTSSVGTSAELASAVEAGLSNYGSGQSLLTQPHTLQVLNLATVALGHDFANAAITITGTPSTGLGTLSGNGLVNVGEINANGINLKSVTIHGDLGQIVVGGGSATGLGLGALNVQSMGEYGLITGANSTVSRFINGVTSITVAHDVDGLLLRADASGTAPLAKIGAITIGGNLVGGTASDTGEIAAADGIGSVKILGSVIGGTATDDGRIATSVSGRLPAGAGGNIGSIYIGGDLEGGSAQATGAIFCAGTLGSVTIAGSLIGGSAITSGGIDGNSIGTVSIGRDLIGASFSSSSSVDHTAFIRSQGNIRSVTVGGSLIPGAESGGGTLTFSAAIQAGLTLGPVDVHGSIQGTAATPVVISGSGLANPTKHTQDPAVESVTVTGSSTYAVIEAGYGVGGATTSGDAQIGTVKVGGDLIATDIIAGVKVQTAGSDFGMASDSLIDVPSATVTKDGILSSIASIVVGGQIEGATGGATFGIEAQSIGSISTGGIKIPLKSAASGGNDFVITPTISATTEHDVRVRDNFPLDT